MRLKKDFITHMMGDEQVMVGVGSAEFKGLVKNNKTAAIIVDMLKEGTSKEKIIQNFLDRFEVTEEVVTKDVTIVLEKLASIGALED